MRKFIFLLIATLFAIYTQAQINSKITSTVNPTCSYDSNGSAAVIAFGGTPPYTYLWMPSGQTTDTAVGLHASITYTVMITDAVLDTDLNYVTLNPASTLAASTSSVDVSCFGGNNGLASVFPNGGSPPYQILWLPMLQPTDTITNLPASTYTSQVTDAAGCQVQNQVTVQQPQPLNVTAFNYGSMAQAIATGGTQPYTYLWSPGGQTDSTVSRLSAGTYTVTVNDANFCGNIAIVTIPPTNLFLYMNPDGQGIRNCGDPGYFYFFIMAGADTALRFNNCTVDIYMGDEFLGDSVSNGGVQVTRGPSFLPGAGNDYNILNVTNLSDTVIQIQFGDAADTSQSGTILPVYSPSYLYPDTMTMFFIRLRIQNSCEISRVNFINTDTTAFISNYTVASGSPYTGPDSALQVVCHCGHYVCYNFDSTADSLCCCVDSFNYRYFDTILYTTISQNTLYATSEYAGGVYYPIACYAFINSFNNPINAGTNAKSIPSNSSILNIQGWGFGNEIGTVKVTNANDSGSMITLDSMDILQWTENLIKVKMPSYLFNQRGVTPGSGPFTVTSACGSVGSSPHNLQINYNIINYDSLNGSIREKLRPNIVDLEPSESFNFVCDTSIWNNKPALACVKKAIREWNCYTGVDWKLSIDSTMAIDTSQPDRISAIYFGNNNYFSTSGTLMQTHSWYGSCDNLSDSIDFKDEADIKIKRQKYFPYGYTWDYDTTSALFTGNILYFYDAILHELGHAIGLNHINDKFSLMYYTVVPGLRPVITDGITYPGPATLLGALDMVNTSAASSPLSYGCGAYGILVPSFRYCIDPTLGVPVVPDNPYNLVLFPNPFYRTDINIAYQLTKNSNVQLKIEDATGRTLLTLNHENEPPGTYGEKINLDALAAGVYFFTANINGQCQTIKFIKI